MNRADAAALLRQIEAAGFHLRVEDGRLLVRPADRLTQAQREVIAASRDALVDLLSGPDEATLQALAYRAWVDPPDWSAGAVQVRESVILRWSDGTTIALAPEQMVQWERMRLLSKMRRQQPAAHADTQPPTHQTVRDGRQADLFGGIHIDPDPSN